ncbi:MAG: DUF302 domain-containing protein [Thermomicrobiales bacterium]|nr:DUF302 domain-containing protein [Thermomicrobiales bacterium]
MSTMTTPAVEPGFAVELALPIDSALDRVTAALKAEGFGVLTTIDVQVTLKEKIDVDFVPYAILGACNPVLAHRALLADKRVGLLLPCNVMIFEENGRSMVNIANPEVMLAHGLENDDLTAIAAEAAEKLRRVAAALGDAL